jgi:hypothetical protein
MGATIIPFPLIEGARCMVEPRRNAHRERKEPKPGCLCDFCEQRRSELVLADKIARELSAGLEEQAQLRRLTTLLEKDAG